MSHVPKSKKEQWKELVEMGRDIEKALDDMMRDAGIDDLPALLKWADKKLKNEDDGV